MPNWIWSWVALRPPTLGTTGLAEHGSAWQVTAGVPLTAAALDNPFATSLLAMEYGSAADQHGWRVNSPRDPEQRGGTISIDMPDAPEVCRALLKRDILVDYRPKAGVRFSPHFYNTDEEIEVAINAVEEILKERHVTA